MIDVINWLLALCGADTRLEVPSLSFSSMELILCGFCLLSCTLNFLRSFSWKLLRHPLQYRHLYDLFQHLYYHSRRIYFGDSSNSDATRPPAVLSSHSIVAVQLQYQCDNRNLLRFRPFKHNSTVHLMQSCDNSNLDFSDIPRRFVLSPCFFLRQQTACMTSISCCYLCTSMPEI